MKLLFPHFISRLLASLMALLTLLTLTACPMNNLPRNMRLKPFQPHRIDFACVHEATRLPVVTPEAERLFQQGMTLTSYELWRDQRDYKQAAQLWKQAADLGHWKAAMNLAGLYERGIGVERDTEKAVLIVEGLMKQGVPAAFDKMGTYHQSAIGVRFDIDRAYGFWQLAADMGNPAAQAYLGDKLNAAYDSEQMGVWGNSKIGIQMLECAFAQGNGDAAYRLGQSLDLDGVDYARALATYHEGVKFGNEDCAAALFISFDRPSPLTGNVIDQARVERYRTLTQALEHNPDLRFPNLDKVLPLPPAALPFWDGKPETLIDAAKPVIVEPVVAPTPGANRTGRAHIPEGHLLPRDPMPAPAEVAGGARVIPQYETTAARFSGYWLPQLLDSVESLHSQWNRDQVPLRYAKGEVFDDRTRLGLGPHGGRILWHYLGLPVRRAAAAINPYVARGLARHVPMPATPTSCSGTTPCTRTGIWTARLKKSHPQHAVFHDLWRQAYVAQGQSFPAPDMLHAASALTVTARDLRWHWLGEANAMDDMGHARVTLGTASA
jgi:hypothetical protein